MEIEYFEATVGDAKDVLSYLAKVVLETDYLDNDQIFLNEVEEMEFLQKMNDDSNSVIVIARDGKKIVGMASLEGKQSERLKHRVHLGITVLKDYWHQGIGTNLMSAVIGYAVEAGIEIIDLEVVDDNENAIALYEKFGFEIIGTYENFMKIRGQYVDAYFMNLYL